MRSVKNNLSLDALKTTSLFNFIVSPYLCHSTMEVNKCKLSLCYITLKQKQAMRPLLEPSTSLTWSLYSKAQEFYLFPNFHSSSDNYQNFLPIKKTVWLGQECWMPKGWRFLTQQYRLFSNYSASLQMDMC